MESDSLKIRRLLSPGDYICRELASPLSSVVAAGSSLRRVPSFTGLYSSGGECNRVRALVALCCTVSLCLYDMHIALLQLPLDLKVK